MTAVAQRSPAVPDRLRAGWERYWFEPVPPERVDVFARVLAVVVLFTVFHTDQWAVLHERAPTVFFRPILLARVAQLGPPGPASMTALLVVLALAATWMFTRRAPRAACATVFVAYGVWLLWAFSYSKVDHDRLTIMVALGALALTARSGPYVERWSGWAMRVIQVTFVLAYPFSAWSKIRFGGWGWMSSATFARAIVRRGTPMGKWFLDWPSVLVVAQWSFIAFEVCAVVLLFPRLDKRIRYAALFGVLMLHVMTFALIGISFLPHTVCLLAFLPLERVSRSYRERTVADVQAGVASSVSSAGR